LAYPYGDEDARVVRAAGQAGYEAAGALPARLHEPLPLRWPRIGVYHADRGYSFRLKTSRWGRWMRRRKAWALAAAPLRAARSGLEGAPRRGGAGA
jgi:hypothetical protein